MVVKGKFEWQKYRLGIKIMFCDIAPMGFYKQWSAYREQ